VSILIFLKLDEVLKNNFVFMGKIGQYFTKILEGGVKYSIHVSIIILAVAVIFSDFIWNDELNTNVARADGSKVEEMDAKKIDVLFSFLSQLVPPLNTNRETQNVKFLTEGENFLSKPSLPNTIISGLPRENITTYTVSEGDTYWTIAYKFEINVDTLKWANEDIEDWKDLKPGEKLVILPVNGLLYTVEEGDDLASISSFYGVSQEKILKQNNLVSAQNIIPGQKLILPGAKKYRTYVYHPLSVISQEESYVGRVLTGTGSFSWPVSSYSHYITQYFGWITRWYKHTGIDLDRRNGTDIFAADRGTVVAAKYGWGGGYGNHIIIDHGNGFQTLYAHLSRILVNVGDDVEQGQRIAIMGTTGYSSGVHLHFEIRQDGKAVNPLAYLR